MLFSVPHVGRVWTDEATESFQIKVKRGVGKWQKSQAGSGKAWSFVDLLRDLGQDMASASSPPSARGELLSPLALPPSPPPLQSCCAFRADNGCEAPGFRVILININDLTCSCLLRPGPGPAASPRGGCGVGPPPQPPALGSPQQPKGFLMSSIPSSSPPWQCDL